LTAWTLGLLGCLGGGFGLATGSQTAATAAPHDQSLFLYLALACFAVAALWIVRRLLARIKARRRRTRALRLMWTPEPPPQSGIWLRRWVHRRTHVEAGPRGQWERRARTAEQRADQALAVLRSELTPHLAQIMRDRLVLTLMSQRARLLSAHQANAEKVVALEHRLTAIQMHLRRQAEAYEHRIAQLEKELQEKGVVTRELLKFRVRLARQALEAVRPGRGPA
jgi:hypothetical protein